MNGSHQRYDHLSVEDKKDLRSINEELGKRFLSAMSDLASIKSVGKPNSHGDPHAALEDLQSVVKFSHIPRQYTKPKPKPQITGVESVVKHSMKNEYANTLAPRSASASNMENANSVVDLSKPLPLSFEARRERIMRAHNTRVESSISGLFSKNSQVNKSAPQGPVPDLYTPPPTSRRFEIEAAKQVVLSQMIHADKRTKESIIQSSAKQPPQLLGKKVPKNFVPRCCDLTVGEARTVIAHAEQEKHSKIVSAAPFK